MRAAADTEVTLAGTILVAPKDVRAGDEFYAAYGTDGTQLAWGDGDRVDGDATDAEFTPSYRRAPYGTFQLTFDDCYVNLPESARVLIYRAVSRERRSAPLHSHGVPVSIGAGVCECGEPI